MAEKEKPESTLKLKAGTAWFFAPEAPNLSLTIKPMVERLIGPNQGFQTVPDSGEHVEFENCRYHTNILRVIKWLVNHPLFEVDFYPDPTDPTGYWKAAGYFDEVSETKLTRAERSAAIQEEARIASRGVIPPGEVDVTDIRTSNT